jgi:hypothetical protein
MFPETSQQAASASDVLSPLPPEFDKEIAFQLDKYERRQAEALSFGHLQVHELSHDELARARVLQQGKEANDKKAVRAKARKDQAMSPSRLSVDTISSMKIFVAPDFAGQAFPGNLTDNMLDADVFIVPSLVLSDLGVKAQLAACMVGAYLIQPVFFKNGKHCVKYHRALNTWRRLHLTAKFREGHPKVADLLRAGCAKRGSRGRLLDTVDAIVTAREQARASTRNLFIVLKSSRDGAGPLEGLPAGMNCKLINEFQESIARVDPTKTAGTGDVP